MSSNLRRQYNKLMKVVIDYMYFSSQIIWVTKKNCQLSCREFPLGDEKQILSSDDEIFSHQK